MHWGAYNPKYRKPMASQYQGGGKPPVVKEAGKPTMEKEAGKPTW
jgi:hypothetical protein